VVSPSNQSPWIGWPDKGQRFTRAQIYYLRHRGFDPATVEWIMVRRCATLREMWWGREGPTPAFEFACPIILRRADGRLTILAPIDVDPTAPHRMDRRDVEHHQRLRRPLAWLHQLLCDEAGGTRLKQPSEPRRADGRHQGRPVWNGEDQVQRQWLEQPIRWKRPRKIFVCAHGDLFHESVPDEWIDRVFAVMALANGISSRC
jgi:hypothetical protein